MASENPGTRIPTSLSTDRKLFGQYTLTDLAVAACPGVVVALAMQMIVPASVTLAGVPVHSLTLPIASVAVAGGALFVYLSPRYTSSLDWLLQWLGYATTSSRRTHVDARALTHVERFHPAYDAVERTDGAVVGFVSVHPPTMALATTAEWTRKATAFQDVLNATVEFAIQIYSTTRPFDVEDHVAQYTARLDDDDVAETPMLGDLIEGYVEWHAEDQRNRPMSIRDHYVVVPVQPADVQFEATGLTAQVADLPVLGLVVELLFAPPRAVQRREMLETLAERRRQVARGLRDLQGCEAHPVSADRAARLLEEYWTGTEPAYDQLDDVLRTKPMVGTEVDG